MVKYFFYKIQSMDINITDTYVGKTTNLKKRESYHKHTCNNPNSNYYNLKLYNFIRDFEAYKLKKQLKKEVMNALMNHHQILNHIFIIYIIQH